MSQDEFRQKFRDNDANEIHSIMELDEENFADSMDFDFFKVGATTKHTHQTSKENRRKTGSFYRE